MILVGDMVLKKYATKHAEIRDQIGLLIEDIKTRDWKTPHDLKSVYPDASFLSHYQVVFNLKQYRILTQIIFESKTVRVCKCGTHNEYMTWNLK
jgi:mRNA interferase HigB